MQYGDEKIIAERVATAEREKLSIAKRVEINNISYEFASRSICDLFSITLPTNFEELPGNLTAIKYPSVKRPEIILSNPDSTVDMFFDCGDRDMDTSLKNRITKNRAVVKELHKSYVFSPIKAGSILAYYDFRSHALDGDIYNLWFLADLPDNTVFGGFSCPIHWQPQWQLLIPQMLQSIAVLPKRE